MKSLFSLQGRFIFLLAGILVAAVSLSVFLVLWLPYWPVVLPVVIAFTLGVTVVAAKQFFTPIDETLQALRSGVDSFKDHDYSVSIANNRDDELGQLVTVYNELASTLREERFSLFQRELLLDTVIQNSAVAVVITSGSDVIVFSNRIARDLFDVNSSIDGFKLMELCEKRSDSLAEAVANHWDGLFTLEGDGNNEVYHLTFRRFNLNAQVHRLYLFKKLTREISRQEVETWKKVIRVISHELNNSLAPISSLTRSAKVMLDRENTRDKLEDIFASIANRADHLHHFIEQYAKFARLPKPKVEAVDWDRFMTSIQSLCTFTFSGELPEAQATFDPTQIEQVLINLIKNAHESGSPEEDVVVRILQDQHHALIAVEDRGTGMDSEQMESALLPFYSTKRAGTGLGLPLCREIVESHGGTFRLYSREGGGVAATCKLPLVELPEA